MAAITDSVQFPTGGQKFNFVCSKRTFSMLVSPYFNNSTENLICEEIVLKMGLSILDRNCETLSIRGLKTEAVGFIKTTVQCLKNGCQNGTTYLKARVVRDFYKLFGSDGLCSESMTNKLSPSTKAATDDSTTSDNEEPESKTEPTDKDTPKPKKKPKANYNYSPESNFRSPAPSSSTSSPQPSGIRNVLLSPNPSLPPAFYSPYFPSKPGISSLNSTPIKSKSPPGFPFPQYPTTPAPIKVPYNLPEQPNTAMMSPYSVNISRLTAAFGDADIMENFGDRRAILTELELWHELCFLQVT